ncbi:MAG: response regulator transcription factor [Nitrospirae bacterium]|nr:response regulator transcription factor [Nitrospirota bacterium]
MKKRVIVVDDEKDIVELLSYNLQKEGFEVACSYDGEDGLKKIKNGHFDLIILDLMLPGIQGIDLCRILKGSGETVEIPIIMLTAKNDELDKVLGLEMGADDYMTKPFSVRELLARVKVVLRRSQEKVKMEKIITIGDIEIDTQMYKVSKRGVPVKLSATEFKLLQYMIHTKGKVLTRDMLLDAVWKDEAYVEPRTVDVHIRRLRAQIEDNTAKPRYIKTRRGIGYYFEDSI